MGKNFSSWKKSLAATAVAAALTFAAQGAMAGDTTGGITGSVVNAPQQGVSYTVTIRNMDTGFTRDMSTDQSGGFRFPQLPIGSYEITVTKGNEILGHERLRVSIGNQAFSRIDLSEKTEVIDVVGTSVISFIDRESADSGLTIGEAEFDRLPVGRNTTAIAMLAPGTVKGDSAFGDLPSFSGSSVAENVCYINGLNVTDPDKGLGCGSVPFEMFKEFSIKTGGYSAEYGRATGGVINAVTKSGGNEFEFASTAYYEPEAWRADGGRVVKRPDGRIFRDTRANYNDTANVTLSASGPIIEDKLFFYAIYNPRRVESGTTTGFTRTSAPSSVFFNENEDSSDFWAAKIDWEMADGHRLEAFTFSDKRELDRETVDYHPATREKETEISKTRFENGGDSQSLKYIGNLTDKLTVSAMMGQFGINSSTLPGNQCPGVTDGRPAPDPEAIGCGPGGSLDINEITRDVMRLDIEWAFMDGHVAKLGYDSEEVSANHTTDPTGGGNYTYGFVNPGQRIDSTDYINTTNAVQDYVKKRVFAGGGEFEMNNAAIYIEDKWTISDQWFVSAGLRADVFENKGKDGKTFVEITDQLAPRLGITFAPSGDNTSKIFANYGKYFFPIPVNTNYRVSSGISDITTTHLFTGINAADGTPTGTTLIDTHVNSSGAVPEAELAAAPELEAMYLNEYILGYQAQLSPEYSMTVRGTIRKTANAIDDYCDRLTDPSGDGNICTLFNPGNDATFGTDTDGDGQIDPGSQQHYTAEEIGMPKAHREYHAIQFDLNHLTKDLFWNFQYVWSRSFGNNEGGVKSDNEQTDTGVTTDYDFAALMDGAEGYLPNDRRHVLKFYGSYKFTDAWTFGWNSSLFTGRPMNATGRGYPPDGQYPTPGYGDTYWTCYKPTGSTTCSWLRNDRGDAGRMPTTFNLDTSVGYEFSFAGMEARASLDIFNLLNLDGATKLEERYESAEGTPNPYYGYAKQWQQARSVRLGIDVKF